MRHSAILLIVGCLALVPTSAALACGGGDSVFEALLSDNSDERELAIASLRDEGPAALDRLFAMRGDLEQVYRGASDETKRAVAAWSLRRLDRMIDRVGGQRYCTVSRLYWHTDLDAALASAQQTGKPILSLRMLGNLTDEYSCANSRFFRTTLYANEGISKTLRENFVLHWQSVRPVPVVTVDFGDGRKLKRTLTGNSAHYLLAADGRPLDVLPGLYHPQAFAAWLADANGLAHRYAETEPWERDGLLRQYHAGQRDHVLAQWQGDLEKIGAAKRPEARPVAARRDAPPKAAAAMRVAQTKARIEAPLLQLVVAEEEKRDPAQLEQSTGEDQWASVAILHRHHVELDDASRDLIRSELRANATKASELIRSLEESIGLDTVRNEYRLHRRIHEWFASDEAGADLDALNDRVYAELFLTPSTDPWLGLAPSDAYTALDHGGVVAAP